MTDSSMTLALVSATFGDLIENQRAVDYSALLTKRTRY